MRIQCLGIGLQAGGDNAEYMCNHLGLDDVSATTIHPSDLIKSSMKVCYVM